MEEWIQLGKDLRRFVNPDTFPVAVKLLPDDSEMPSSTSELT